MHNLTVKLQWWVKTAY